MCVQTANPLHLSYCLQRHEWERNPDRRVIGPMIVALTLGLGGDKATAKITPQQILLSLHDIAKHARYLLTDASFEGISVQIIQKFAKLVAEMWKDSNGKSTSLLKVVQRRLPRTRALLSFSKNSIKMYASCSIVCR